VVPVSKRRHVGDRILCSTFLEGKGDNAQGPICDAIIDFGDINQSLPEKYTAQDPEDASLGVFSILGEEDFVHPDQFNALETMSSDATAMRRPDLQADVATAYPSPTQTVVGDPPARLKLPSYIALPEKSISPEDWDHLKRRGVFDIPDAPLRDLLLQAYAKWVHPFMPMLDLEGILASVFSNGSTQTVSLLVFQSMLFAATKFLATDLGHGNRKSSQKAFYDRAKLLHDFDIESDRLAICQSTILLSFWDGDCEKVRDSYYWIGVATLHATSIGLHSDPKRFSADLGRQRFLKLTSWSLLIRDRLLAVALRRPVQNQAFRFDVPMLQVEDFGLESLFRAFRDTSLIQDIQMAELETLASTCVALAQLSEYIDRILFVQYSVQRNLTNHGQSAAVVSLVPRVTGFKSSEMTSYGQELQNWYGYLPMEVQQEKREHDDPEGETEHKVVQLHRALLAGYYAMTLMTLYRPLLVLPSPSPADAKVRTVSMKIVSQSARSITDIFGRLYADNLIECLPDTAIAAMEPAAVTHLLYSMSEVPKDRETSFQKFYICWRMLLRMGQSSYLADTTISMLNAAAQRLKCHPEPSPTKPAACSGLCEATHSTGDKTSESRVAVPFVGVVGNQKNDSTLWTDDDSDMAGLTEGNPNESSDEKFPEDDHILDTNPVWEASTFDQLISWDSLEDGLDFDAA
jgi:hypothetical protein